MELKNTNILVGMTGGIACYKVPNLVRALRKAEAEVQVVMTKAATEFITTLTLETVSSRTVYTEMFAPKQYVGTRHIDLAEWPDLIVVAPATANFMGKVANGVSDDLLTTVMCASARPVMIAPAMNPQMWLNPVTQRNHETLRSLGYHFVDPGEGEMACDHYGVGRMAEPDQIFEAIREFFATHRSVTNVLRGKQVLVTAGPCREPIDPVRYISNRSSGRMGFAIAEMAAAAGATTTLISGPSALLPPANVSLVRVETTDQMAHEVTTRFDQSDCLFMAAAPADFTVKQSQESKIRRGDGPLTLELVPTIDILAKLSGRKKAGQVLIGFALETSADTAEARHKLERKGLDLIVYNRAGAAGSGFDTATNQVTLLAPGRPDEPWPILSKREVATRLIQRVGELLAVKQSTTRV